MKGEERTYRRLSAREGLTGFQVVVKETDLHVQAARDLSDEARELILLHRGHLEAYIAGNTAFLTTLAPWPLEGPAAPIVRLMSEAGRAAGVGPMAAVAGAVAQLVGEGILIHSAEVIVENGGDVWARVEGPFTAAVFAGKSPLSGRIGIRLDGGGEAFSVCTSSATVGHSLSLGKADAAVVVARSGALADACATALGNRVKDAGSLASALEFVRGIPYVLGAVAVVGDKLAVWGDIELVPIVR